MNTVVEKKRRGTVSVRIESDTPQECWNEVNKYLERWKPQGYGTEIEQEPTPVAPNKWCAMLWRLESCE